MSGWLLPQSMVASIVQAPAGSVISNASLLASFPTLVPLTRSSYDLSRRHIGTGGQI